LVRIGGDILEADGPMASVGDYCEVETAEGAAPLIAEVVSVDRVAIRLTPVSHAAKLSLGAAVCRARQAEDIPVGDCYAGRAIDALARPLVGAGEIWPHERLPRSGRPLPHLDRVSPSERLETGIRAIDALLPLGRGQRAG